MTGRTGRRPGPTTTRDDILDAATETFLDGKLEHASMRRIAQRAGVDPALIYRFFASKDALFDEVVRREFGAVIPVDRPVRDGREVITLALDLWESRQRRTLGLGAIRAALNNDQAAALLRELLGRTILRWMTASARDDHHDLRVALIASQIVGLVITRHRLQLPGAKNASRDELIRVLAPVLEHYLHGDLGLPGR